MALELPLHVRPVVPSREYTDSSGVVWEVFEVHRLNNRPHSVRASLSLGWLAFVSAADKRRLPNYPADWMLRSDDELEELLRASSLTTVPMREVPAAERAPLPAPEVSNARPRRPSAAVGLLGASASEKLVRAHARQARIEGISVIKGIIGAKMALEAAGGDTSAEGIKELRKIFVEEFYFAR